MAGLSAGYFCLVPICFWIVNTGVPMWLEHLLLLLAAPGVLLMLPWLPLLQRLGLSQGEWIVGPSLGAYIALSLAYTLAASGLALLICRLPSR